MNRAQNLCRQASTVKDTIHTLLATYTYAREYIFRYFVINFVGFGTELHKKGSTQYNNQTVTKRNETPKSVRI